MVPLRSGDAGVELGVIIIRIIPFSVCFLGFHFESSLYGNFPYDSL